MDQATTQPTTIQRLAEILGGAGLTAGAAVDADDLMQVAMDEGVVALLHARLHAAGPAAVVPAALREGLARAAQVEAARSLYLENRCRQILACLATAQLPVLLLKGSALAYGAYAAPHLRKCGDIDLLVRSRAEVEQVLPLLAALGYHAREYALPGDLVCFEVTCVSAADAPFPVEIDLHWRLSSTPMFAFRFDWNELSAQAIALPTLAPNARGLAPVHAYLHACMHRMQNRSNGVADRLKWLYDLDLLGRGFSASDWDRLATLAIERGLAGVCRNGVLASAARFGDVMPASVLARLAGAAPDEALDVARMDRWWYVQRMSLSAWPTLGLKLRWLRQRLVPDRAYLRERYGAGASLPTALLQRLRAALKRVLARGRR